MDRRHQLKQFHQVLNTEQGQALMEELKSAWDTANPLHEEPSQMGFNIGLQQAYRQLEAWQKGEGLNE